MRRAKLLITLVAAALLWGLASHSQYVPAISGVNAPPEAVETFMNGASTGDVRTIDRLLGDYPDLINATQKDGKTALHRAAMVGKKKAVELLLDRGADVNARDKYGKTPLYYARIAHFRGTAKLITYRGGKK